MNEKLSTALSNHVSSLLAQQNHVVQLCIDMIASRVINPRRAYSNSLSCCDVALIFLRPNGSQMFRSAQFFMYGYQTWEKEYQPRGCL